MRIALVHDYLKEYGGAERVLETLHEMYPDAPVYTLIYAPQFLGPHKERFSNWDIRPSFLQYIPFSYKFISIYRLIAPWVFKTFDFSKFDIVIVSATGAYQPNSIRTKKLMANSLSQIVNKENHTSYAIRHRPIHICYCHTPPRYLYGYATAREQPKNLYIKAVVSIMCHVLRMVDFRSSQNVDQFIANSKNIASRIQKFYRRESVVIYPPVDIPSSFPRRRESGSSIVVEDDKKYYLCGGRLARPKHIDLIVKVCAELNIALKVFGKSFAGYEEELKKLAMSNDQGSIKRHSGKPKERHFEEDSTLVVHPESKQEDPGQARMTGFNIEFLGEIRDEEKLELMKHAKAFIFAAEDEDFGIVPVEAMGQGTPVIAYKSGGVLETVVDGKTGIFFDELTVESLSKAVKRLEALWLSSGEKLAEDCYQQAQKFSKEAFIQGIQKIVNNLSS